jgi:EAL domain-containing protein (putative c-di-GMP-specific phosphodiesterase class I)
MAFQPIVDLARRRIYAYEALVRGPRGESAFSVLEQVNPVNRYAFDQTCRVTAIDLAARLGIIETGAKLSINFIPGAMYRPETCVRTTLTAAKRAGIATDQIVLELTENERIINFDLLSQIFDVYRRHALRIAIDDFGAGFSGIGLLARFQPDVIKLDMEVVRGVDDDARRRVIIANIIRMAAELGLDVVAEGVETEAELSALLELGVTLIQGYYFAKPAFEALPRVML